MAIDSITFCTLSLYSVMVTLTYDHRLSPAFAQRIMLIFGVICTLGLVDQPIDVVARYIFPVLGIPVANSLLRHVMGPDYMIETRKLQ